MLAPDTARGSMFLGSQATGATLTKGFITPLEPATKEGNSAADPTVDIMKRHDWLKVQF